MINFYTVVVMSKTCSSKTWSSKSRNLHYSLTVLINPRPQTDDCWSNLVSSLAYFPPYVIYLRSVALIGAARGLQSNS